MKKIAIGLIVLFCFSCRNRTEKWLDSLSSFERAGDEQLTVEALKPAGRDTTAVLYNVRIYPSKTWLDHKNEQATVRFNYAMDSCFYLSAGGLTYKANVVQPVANGLTNCFEYLVSFDLDPAMETGKASLIYQDKYINNQRYTLALINK